MWVHSMTKNTKLLLHGVSYLVWFLLYMGLGLWIFRAVPMGLIMWFFVGWVPFILMAGLFEQIINRLEVKK